MTKYSFVFILFFMSTISFANNISLSTQRIYLDQQHPNANFVIRNRDAIGQSCNLGITYFQFDEEGSMSAYDGTATPVNAAENVARFSPKHFKIEPNGKQIVRFKLRRKSDTPEIEHRSYITVKCKVAQEKDRISVSGELATIPIRAQLQHNIPLIVRPKKLNAKLWFSDVSLTDNKLSLVLHREGTKSVYGKVTLLEKNSGNTLSQSANFAIYHETKAKSLYMTVPEGVSLEHLKIEFNEAKEEGDVSASWQASSAGE